MSTLSDICIASSGGWSRLYPLPKDGILLKAITSVERGKGVSRCLGDNVNEVAGLGDAGMNAAMRGASSSDEQRRVSIVSRLVASLRASGVAHRLF